MERRPAAGARRGGHGGGGGGQQARLTRGAGGEPARGGRAPARAAVADA